MDYTLGIQILTELRGLSTAEHIRLIAETGWQGCTMKWDPALSDEATEAAARHGLFFQSFHAPTNGIEAIWEQGERGEDIAQRMRACLCDCADHGVPIMIVHPHMGFGDEDTYSPSEIGLRRFGTLVELAESKGVRLAFENMEIRPYLRAIFGAFGDSEAVGFCLDTGHQMCYHKGYDFLAEFGSRLIHTHLNDNLGQRGDHATMYDDLHMVMGDGVIDWHDVMQKIRRTGYRGMLMCELNAHNKWVGHHEMDRYEAMGVEEFYAYAYQAAVRITSL